MLVHLQNLAASAELLPAITIGTVMSAPINAKCSNRMVVSYLLASICWLCKNGAMLLPQCARQV
jgi:hypothetical protein